MVLKGIKKGVSAEHCLPTFAVVVDRRRSFIRIEYARHELQNYCYEFVRDKLAGVPSEADVEDCDADNVYNFGDGR